MLPRPRFSALSALNFLLLLSTSSNAFYLPGVSPTSYTDGDVVPLYVNHLTPSETDNNPNVQSVYSFDYYSSEFHFCQPSDGPKQVAESLGSILFGDRIFTSPFALRMRQNVQCAAVCAEAEPVTFPPADSTVVNQRILMNYIYNWLVDGLPAGMQNEDMATGDIFTLPGFPLGQINTDTGKPILHNHYEIHVEYHEAASNEYRVVGFRVAPYSRADTVVTGTQASCGSQDSPALQLSEDQDTKVAWTYSVVWERSDTPFATRWDKYLHVYDPKIHWFWLINSAVIVCLLVGMVSTILLRTLRKDIARYNRLDQDIALEDYAGTGIHDDDGLAEDSGWKLVHADVFRPPRYPLPLAVLVGNGVQLFLMTGFTIAFALFGFLSPSNRGSLGTVMILFYTVFGFANGYVSARVYKFLNGEGWRRLFMYTPMCLPLFVFAVFFFLNLFVWARGASGAVPFGTMLVLVLIWFVISLPLSLAGSWLGFRSEAIRAPTRTNAIPRQIPPPIGWMKPIPAILVAGVLPFTAISVELSFILSSLWSGRFYYMFGFLFLCFGLMVMMCAAVTVLMVYFMLCAENYNWHWRAFYSAGATGAYVFVYALFHWVRSLSFASWTSGVLYLGYSALMSVLVFVLTGTIGFLASWLFVLKIYDSIKVD
ncbi:putative endosomal integral membrane protein [Microthyrium microscopicum]|uniref:Transmembrane 9 superfamily member n=1 Tax=Microthyrium microscopicum TaxID=703497 RepID=A0A6A6UFS1_9PEZI|nr:putative endosomal integral membrane protein [Microthyrium microscopicum]